MNKIILVTGAGRGLGYCIVSQHLAMKDRVYAFDYQITDELKKLAEENDLLSIYHCDIASDESVATAMQDVLESGEQIDIIYNVAGIFKVEGRVGLAETDMDMCMQMFNVNALGAMRVCKNVFPLIGEGSLVLNISSEAGSIGAARRSQEYGYCMSKAALNMGAKILSNELWSCSARVMIIHPGWLRTSMGGPDAFASNNSIVPEESAANIIEIALNIDDIPRDQMYMHHTGEILPW